MPPPHRKDKNKNTSKMLHLISEYCKADFPVPLAFSAASPAARRAVESSSRGFVVTGLRLHHEEFRKDEEVLSCHRRPTRTVCIHTETLPPTLFHALWWIAKDGEDVPVVFRAARLTGSLHYGIAEEAAAAETPETASMNVVCLQNPHAVSLVQRTVSLFLGGSRLRAVTLNPAAVARLERLDVSNCRCLKSLQWCSETDAAPLRRLRILKASFSGLTTFPAARFVEWAPAITTALLSGCRALIVDQVNSMLDDCMELRVVRLDSTKLSRVDSLALTCPCLAELNVSNCGDLHEVTALSALETLRVLDLHGNVGLTSLEGVGNCGPLRRLDISHCKRIATLAPLEGMLTQLRYFNASYCTGLRDTHLRALQVCTLLEEVKVNECSVLRDFTALSQHANLLVLEAADTALASVNFLRGCTALERLSVAGCAQLKDLAALRGLCFLSTVDACYTGVTRVAELVDTCAALRVVLVRECNLDAESTDRLDACATRIASTHRMANTSKETAAVTA